MARFAKRRTQNKPAYQVILGLIDSESKYKTPEQFAPMLRNEISTLEDDFQRKQANKKLNDAIEYYYYCQSLLQESPENDVIEQAEPVAIEASAQVDTLAELPLFAVQENITPELDLSSEPKGKLETAETETIALQWDLDLGSGYVDIDPVLGLYAIRAGLSVLFAQWANLRHIARKNGVNHIVRNDAITVIRQAMGCTERNASNILKSGGGFWDYDHNRARYYLRAEDSIALRLARRIPFDIVCNSIPGNRRYFVKLTGSKHAINANLYAAYLYTKAEKQNGRLYVASRELLTYLFGVSKPTLIAWERIAGIKTRARFAMQADTTIENSPKHAYLRAGDNGQDYVEYQLSNAYYPPEILSRANRGSSRKTKTAILEFIDTNKPATYGSGDNESDSLSGGLQSLGRLNFEGNKDNWLSCDKHLRKHQDPFRAHYMGSYENVKNGVSIAFLERYNPTINAPLLEGVKPDFDAEKTPDFIARKMTFDTGLGFYHGEI